MTSTATHRIPGISCDACGRWASSSRLRVPLPPEVAEFVGVTFLSVMEWTHARDRWASVLGVVPGLIEPGAKLGPPSGTCSAAIAEDIVHPIPGEVWVARRVSDALQKARLTGVSFVNVHLAAECGDFESSELIVHGRAGRRGVSEESLRLCDICGRRGFPSPRELAVDEERWDGSDFVFLDRNPNIVVVTERVAGVFSRRDFTNVMLEPIA